MSDTTNANVPAEEYQKATEELYKRNLELANLYKERERLNKELAEANEKLKSLDKLKTEFLSLASHQLRSPMTAIKGYASMLMDGSFGKIEPAQEEPLHRIFESTNHLVNVVSDLLNVSKIEQGGMVYTMAVFDLKKTTLEITHDLEITANDKHISLTYSDDGHETYAIVGDGEKIRQCVLNLIDNAVKYTKEGSVKVALSKNVTENTITFSVTDSGVGMSPETKEKLFQKFARGEGRLVDAGGSGLGLYLAKQIVAAHKGTLAADSPGVGKGSTFSMTFPTNIAAS